MIADLKYIRNYVVHERKAYFVAGNYDELFAVNMDDRYRTEIVCRIPWIKNHGSAQLFRYQGYLVIAASCNQVVLYNLITQELSLYIWNEREQQEMLVATIVDDQLFVYPRDCPGELLSFSLTERKFLVEESWHIFFDTKKEVQRFMYGIHAMNNILFCCQGSKILYVYDLSANKLSCLELSVEGGIFAINFLKEKLYITSADRKSLYITDAQFEHWEKYDLEGTGHFAKPQLLGDQILLFDEKGLLVFEKGLFSRCEIPELLSGVNTWFFTSFTDGDKQIFLPWTANRAVIYDMKKKEFVDCFSMRYPRKALLEQNPIIREGKMELTDFLEAII